MKKILFFVFGILVTGLPLSAGGQSGGGAAGSGAQAGNSLTVACFEGWYSAVSMNDNLPVWQEIEKKTGIHINWQANSDYDAAMQPVIASGSRLPDIMAIPPTWGNSGVYKLGRDGIILQLDDLIAKNAPNIVKLFKDYPALKPHFTAPDGNQYSVGDVVMFVNDLVVNNSLFIRQDWLDKLGLKQPATLDEWHNVLIAFRDRDPNGNGRKDEIPFAGIGSPDGYLMAFGPAFGLPNGGTWWYDKSGKVFHVKSSPQYRQFLQTMSQWYKEGLISLEIVQNETSLNSLASTNVIGAFVTLDGYKTQYDNLLKTSGVSQANHSLIPPPKTPDGSNPQMIKRDPVWSHYGITKDAKNPVLAIQWIDYIWGSDEGVTLNEYGVEGKSWIRGPNGKPQLTDYVLHNPDGLDQYNALRALGASNTFLNRTPEQVYIDLMQGGEGPVILKYAESVRPFRVEPFPALILSDEDQSVIDRISPDVNTYMGEMVLKFIIGEIPLSEWDTYVRTLQSMGLNDLLAIQQKQYDRSK